MGNRGSAGDSVVWQAQLLHTMLQAAEDIHRTRVSIIHSRMAVYCMRFGIQEARFGFDSVRLCLSLSLPLCIASLTVSLFLSWLNVVHGWTVGGPKSASNHPSPYGGCCVSSPMYGSFGLTNYAVCSTKSLNCVFFFFVYYDTKSQRVYNSV